MINRIISHYRIVEEIAQGGMGIVYKAEDIHLKRFLALKFLHPDMTKDQESIERFINEAQAVSKLDHSNICNIYEIDKTEDGQLFMAMSYYEGETLYERLNEIKQGSAPPISPKEAINIAVQVAKGLSRAHESGIYHRDIKPGNIMITNRGEVKILDFGLAKLAGQTRITKRGSTIGTITYMSPEQAGGDTIDHRTDLWSLGVVMYEILTTQPPFRGEMEMAVIYSILKKPPAPINEMRTDVSPGLAEIVHRALEKQPGKRFQSANEMISELIALPEAEKFWDSKESFSGWKKLYRRIFRWRIRITAAVSFLVIALFIILWIWNPWAAREMNADIDPRETIRKQNSLTILHFGNNTNDARYDNLGKNIAYLLINSLSQSKYIGVLSADKLYDILQSMNHRPGSFFSARDLDLISRKTGTNYMLIGHIFKIQDRFRVSINLKKREREEPVYVESLEGLGEESIFQIVDDLAMRVKTQFNLTTRELADDFSRSAAQITTASNEALNNYVQARELYLQKKFRQSIELLQEAVEMDPEYALAYWLMAINQSYLGEYQARNKNLVKAVTINDRISVRDRLLIEGYTAFFLENNLQKAIQKYSGLLSIFPDDEDGRIFLANLYRNMEMWDSALTQYRAILRFYPDSFSAYLNIAFIEAKLGHFEQAINFMKERLDQYQSKNIIYEYLSVYHLLIGEFDEAGTNLQMAITTGGDAAAIEIKKAGINFIRDEYDKCLDSIRLLRSDKDARGRAMADFFDANYHLYFGKIKECLQLMDHAIQEVLRTGKEFETIAMLLSKIRICFASGDYSQVMELASRAETLAIRARSFDQQIPSRFWFTMALIKKKQFDLVTPEIIKIKEAYSNLPSKRIARFVSLLESNLEMERGNFKKALQYLDNIMEQSHSFFLNENAGNTFLCEETIALLYKKLGDWKKAGNCFEKIQASISGKLVFPDIHMRSFFHLGEIYFQLGEMQKSRRQFQHFYNIRRNGDYESDLVKKSLERLSGLGY